MLPPVLEIYVVWHPEDDGGEAVAEELAAHFHGGAYTSLLGGAVEVYIRSSGWKSPADAPRPIIWPGTAPDRSSVAPAQFTAVVPLVGLSLMRAVDDRTNPWHGYLAGVVDAQRRDPQHVQVFPMRLDSTLGGHLAGLLTPMQFLAEPDAHAKLSEPIMSLRRRDLTQGLAQWMSFVPNEKLQVFISHTKRLGTPDEPVASLIDRIHDVLESGRIGTFYDSHDLQPGEDWDKALRDKAATSAVLAVRTDLYSSREWCQREVLIAKVHGMPVVVLEAMSTGEVRGSFLMDHTPRIPVRYGADGTWGTDGLRRAVNLLADAWLHRVLWQRQRALAATDSALSRYWWAPQAPEPSTLVAWLPAHTRPFGASVATVPPQAPGNDLRILHPDPPLATDERQVLQQMATLAGYGQLDLTTPRLLAARGAGAAA